MEIQPNSLNAKKEFEHTGGMGVDLFQSHSGVTSLAYDISTAYSERLLLDDFMKLNYIRYRKPEPGFQFPARVYRNKCTKVGFMKNYCQMSWLDLFDFAAYSRLQDGLYCLACVLFPMQLSRSCPKMMVTNPGTNFKHAKTDLRDHGRLPYHQACYAEMQAFLTAMLTTD